MAKKTSSAATFTPVSSVKTDANGNKIAPVVATDPSKISLLTAAPAASTPSPFDVKAWSKSGFKVGKDAASIKAMAQNILANKDSIQGYFGSSAPESWANSAMTQLAQAEKYAGKKDQNGRDLGAYALEKAYNWISGAAQPSHAAHIQARADKYARDAEHNLSNNQSNIDIIKGNIAATTDPAEKARFEAQLATKEAKQAGYAPSGELYGVKANTTVLPDGTSIPTADLTHQQRMSQAAERQATIERNAGIATNVAGGSQATEQNTAHKIAQGPATMPTGAPASMPASPTQPGANSGVQGGTKVHTPEELTALQQAGLTGADIAYRDEKGGIYLKDGVTLQSLWEKKIPFKSNLNSDQKSGIIGLITNGGHGVGADGQPNGTLNDTDAKNFAYATGQLNWQKFSGKSGQDALGSINLPYVAKADPKDTAKSMEDTINSGASDLYGATKSNASATDKYTKDSAKTDATLSTKGVDLGATWAEDKFTELFGDVNAKDIAAVNDALITNQKELDKIKILEDQLVTDIRKEVSGEAPESYIQALALDRASAFAPKKAELLSEKTALTTQKTDMVQTAKEFLNLELQDKANALTSLDGYIAKGLKFEDLSPASVASMDKVYGEGFTKSYMTSSAATTAKKTAQDQAATTFKVYSDNDMWDKMSPEARASIEKSLGLPSGTIDTLAADHNSQYEYKYSNGPGTSLVELVTDKKTGQMVSTRTIGSTATGGGGGTDSKEEKQIAAFQKDSADVIEKLDSGALSWGAAWDSLHVKYPLASAAKIDEVLGGGYDQNSKTWYGRASEGGGSVNPATGNWVGK